MDTSLIDMDDELRQSIPKASDLKNSQTVQDHMNDIIKKDKIKGCFLARPLLINCIPYRKQSQLSKASFSVR